EPMLDRRLDSSGDPSGVLAASWQAQPRSYIATSASSARSAASQQSKSSVSSPAASSQADYQATKARERAARQAPRVQQRPSSPAGNLSLADAVAAWGGVRPKPDFSGRPSTINIGGQTYREVDNGRANVLVPIDSPNDSPHVSPAE